MCYVLYRQSMIIVLVFLLEKVITTNSLNNNSTILYCPMKAYSCRDPQRRSLILAQELKTLERVQPHMIVLHRCDVGSGCCDDRTTCQVAKFETLQVQILVTDQNGNYKPQYRPLRNHTKCACQSDHNIIK